MKTLALISGALVICGCIAARAAGTGAESATRATERFFSTESIGCEVLNEKVAQEITGEQAAQLFKKDAAGKLAAGWEKHLPEGANQAAPGARGLPEDPKFRAILRKPTQTDPAAQVSRFSETHVIIRISRPAGGYLWHQYTDNIATLQVDRTAAIDELFDLARLTETYAATYKGVQQGDTESKMVEALGRPDVVRPTQAEEFSFAEYESGAIEIALWKGRVFQIRHREQNNKNS